MRMDYENFVREMFLNNCLNMLCVKNKFQPIRGIDRTISQSIWIRICEDIDHNGKILSFTPPKKKNPHVFTRFL